MAHRREKGARGMVTSEYAVGTVGAACIACIMVQLGTQGDSGWLTGMFQRIADLGALVDGWSLPWRARM